MKIITYLDKYFEGAIMFVLSVIMTASIILQVIMRKVFNNSLSWSEELARFAFIWLVFIGISYAVQAKKHIKIDLIYAKLTGKNKKKLEIFTTLLFLVFSVFIMLYGSGIVSDKFALGAKSPSLHIPTAVLYLAVPIGFGLTSIRLVQQLITIFKREETV